MDHDLPADPRRDSLLHSYFQPEDRTPRGCLLAEGRLKALLAHNVPTEPSPNRL